MLAAEALDLTGALVDDITLFGRRVSIIAHVDEQAHEHRREAGFQPVIDRTSVAMWEWPEVKAPPSAVSVAAVVTSSSRWQPALSTVSGFGAFGSTVLVLPRDTPPPASCIELAERYGVWVVLASSSGVTVNHRGRTGPVPTARPTTVTKWTNEVVYARLIKDGLLEGSPAR
ncbi:hypothetical protein [Amycolatopsis sp. cg9]|uniref:hypothetical protein n=1 Tax=Amycolatopsis sp. cg9 TaxID=3238801 RepID=UPI003523AECE